MHLSSSSSLPVGDMMPGSRGTHGEIHHQDRTLAGIGFFSGNNIFSFISSV